jgi:copper chaperone CopZ
MTTMFRRRFLQLVTMASVGGLAPLEAVSAQAATTVIYRVKGFTCITCATGLDTLLSRQKGVASSRSNYPEGKSTVTFDPKQTSEQAIVAFITELGFTVQPDHES